MCSAQYDCFIIIIIIIITPLYSPSLPGSQTPACSPTNVTPLNRTATTFDDADVRSCHMNCWQVRITHQKILRDQQVFELKQKLNYSTGTNRLQQLHYSANPEVTHVLLISTAHVLLNGRSQYDLTTNSHITVTTVTRKINVSKRTITVKLHSTRRAMYAYT